MTLKPQETQGLSSAQAAARFAQFGPNAIQESQPGILGQFVAKLWGPIPWMLEGTVALEVATKRYAEAAVVLVLLLVNAVIAFLHEHRSREAVEVLERRLEIQARVLRDGRWQRIASRQLVPGDVIHVRMGDVVPADCTIADGAVSVDEAVLTGESAARTRANGEKLYSGSTVKHGEATAEVVATGARTAFGNVVLLVAHSREGGHLHDQVFSVVKYLLLLDGVLVIAFFAYGLAHGTSAVDIVSFALTLLIGAIPVALPATFTLATTLGASELARRGVLVTRLSAIEDAATMDVLCTDKTGTLTQNALALQSILPVAGASDADVLEAAAAASDEASQDPLDLAVIGSLAQHHIARNGLGVRAAYHPFDPELKYAQADVRVGGAIVRACKGAIAAIYALANAAPDEAEVAKASAGGARVLAVARDDGKGYRVLGLLAFGDPVRPDAATLLARLRELGVRVIMLTGDALPTAQSVAEELGLSGRALHASEWRALHGLPPDVDVLADVLPEDKYAIVQALQAAGHRVGMTGDGVNDAPALRAAQVGIAVASATDAAKNAASIVLTNPGLAEAVAAVQESRAIFRRMMVYVTNKIGKTIEISALLTIAAFSTSIVPLTPLLMILLIFGNDFATMAIATDNARGSPVPDRWNPRRIIGGASAIGGALLVLSLGVFALLTASLHLPVPQIQTAMFLLLVVTSQGMIYVIRATPKVPPKASLLAASLADVCTCFVIAVFGILVAPIPATLAAAIVGLGAAYVAVIYAGKAASTILKRAAPLIIRS
ncbi:MAG TPA: plasma-membrane proton-efflux P-type ATPase [Candidatus Dormibacteraeota bacterium]|nr:plasma-membrane proton-efflux P-type ATPase [Candidatus Dormibacteraeota bacterium]